jgi:hypothetical protein
VSSDYYPPSVEEPEAHPLKFGPVALWTSVGSWAVGTLVLVGFNVSGHISDKALTWGCGGVLVVVGFAAYMWGSRWSRREFAARVAAVERLSKPGRGLMR